MNLTNATKVIGTLPNHKLIVKSGFDPTTPDLHFGHLVVLLKLKEFQDAGHDVKIIIGDFTAMIGDPTGKNVTRPPLSREQVLENAKTYMAQVGKILDLNKTQILFNSTWLESLTAVQFIELTSTYTVAQMLAREDFRGRFVKSESIGLHEFLYPLLQGYDSVHLRADVEVGGNDQLFNLMVGRELQQINNLRPQCVITMPLLIGLDGVNKMSKSLGNYIAFNDTPDNMFGKVMSMTDELMWDYLNIFGIKTPKEILNLKFQKVNPKSVKLQLASFFVALLHSQEDAETAMNKFESRFSQKHIDETTLEELVFDTNGRGENIVAILRSMGANSNSEAIRALSQNAVKVNGVRVTDKNNHYHAGCYIFQNGKLNIKQVVIK